MKPTFLLFLIVSQSIFLAAFSCNAEDDNNPTREEELAVLENYKETIENLAETSVCNESTECLSIAFGSKPCGGPWSFLIYSTSIDTEQLELWVEDYNFLQSEFNERWGEVSDCSAPVPPTSFECENNVCIPIY